MEYRYVFAVLVRTVTVTMAGKIYTNVKLSSITLFTERKFQVLNLTYTYLTHHKHTQPFI